MNQLKINFHHQKMIHILYMYSHVHGLVYPYHTSIWESNWDDDEIIDQIFIISHFKSEHRFYGLTSWQRSWSSKALGWIEDITTCCGNIEEKWWKFGHLRQFLHYRTKERDLDHHHRQKAGRRCHWCSWGRSCRLYHSVRKIWSFEGNHEEISNHWREISHINHAITSHSTMASQAEDKNPKISRF